MRPITSPGDVHPFGCEEVCSAVPNGAVCRNSDVSASGGGKSSAEPYDGRVVPAESDVAGGVPGAGQSRDGVAD